MTKLCECGCGEPAPISKENDRTKGLVKGEPRRFISGHNRRRGPLTADDYRVEDRGFTTPCWIWKGSRSHKGYGTVTRQGKTFQAHRLMWIQMRGPIPDGLQLDHLCVVRSCINPNHLEPVTPLENVRRSRRTKITDEQAAEMRRLRAAGATFPELAALYDVTPSCAHYTVTKRTA